MTIYRLTDTGLRPADQPRKRHTQPNRAWRSTALWRHLRAAQIARMPYCADCGTTQDLTADHITPAQAGGPIYDPANLTTRCRRHNSAKGTGAPRPRGGGLPGRGAAQHPANHLRTETVPPGKIPA